MSEGILIWGGGGHGKVVADLARALDLEVRGFVDADPAKLGRVVEPGGARVVMMESVLLERVRDAGGPAHRAGVALAVGDNRVRQRCARELDAHLVPALVHPAAVVSPSAELGAGTVVFAGAVINAAACIGRAVIVNSGAVVEHDCEIADAVHVSPQATLAGGVRVGERSWIGAGAVVLQGVRIGADAVVGAGAVVRDDVMDGTTVVGVPARPVSTRKGRE